MLLLLLLLLLHQIMAEMFLSWHLVLSLRID